MIFRAERVSQPQALPESSGTRILVCTSRLPPGMASSAWLLHDVEHGIKFPVRILGADWTVRSARARVRTITLRGGVVGLCEDRHNLVSSASGLVQSALTWA